MSPASHRAHGAQAALDALFAPYDRTDSPGFAVGVALHGRPIYRRGIGMASVELPVALSPSIRMRIGSTTKHFCALAVMLLAEADKLSIDDSPRRVLPELPAWAEAMTLRQLMAHTSGMRDSLDLLLHAAGPGRPTAPDLLFRWLTTIDSVNFPPGASWSYNNGGYVLLTEIVERVSGETFADFLRERILAPVGMHDTMLRPLDTDLVPNSATLHVAAPGGGWVRGVFGTPIGGMGGLVSTVDDMLLWLRHMENPVVGTAATWAAMRTKLTTHGYGLGLYMTEYRGLRTVHHAGGVVGGASQMLKVVDHGLDIVIMTNGCGALDLYNLVDAIIDACIPGLPPAAGPGTGQPESGSFHSAATGRVLNLVAHEGTQAVAIGGMTLPVRLHPDGSWSVAILPTDMRITLVRDADQVVALVVREFGAEDRLDLVVPPVGTQHVPLGHYACASAGLLARVDGTACGPGLLNMSCEAGNLEFALSHTGPGLWTARCMAALPMVMTLEFDEAGFALTTGRTTRLRFFRQDNA
jgi:CubicO group peptidase (beta-lactamase class C family)